MHGCFQQTHNARGGGVQRNIGSGITQIIHMAYNPYLLKYYFPTYFLKVLRLLGMKNLQFTIKTFTLKSSVLNI